MKVKDGQEVVGNRGPVLSGATSAWFGEFRVRKGRRGRAGSRGAGGFILYYHHSIREHLMCFSIADPFSIWMVGVFVF